MASRTALARRAAAILVLLVLTVAAPAPAAVTENGDANADGAVNISDVIFLINHLFAGGSSPMGPADVNGDGVVTVGDVLYLINGLFAGGPAPVQLGWMRGWPGFAKDAQHSGRAPASLEPFQTIKWQTVVDEDPQYL